MSDTDEESDKQHEPTQKKLDDARKRGEVVRSAELNTALSYATFLLLTVSMGAYTLKSLGTQLAAMLSRADQISEAIFVGGAPFSATVMAAVGIPIAPWFITPGVAVLMLTIAMRSFVVAPEKLKPKFNKISPLSNAKNKFGRSGLFEFLKSFVKLTIYTVILGAFLWAKMPQMLGSLSLSAGMATVMMLDLCVAFFVIVLLIALVMGAIDVVWQQHEHLRKNRMSHKELMDEVKQNEGDPHMKQHRRQKGYDIAMNQMLAEVPNADVIIVNPTHYAVALKWSKMPGAAPICVAKGVDEIAARIREIACENGVPIHSDPPTARALHATVEIGQEIPPDSYKAVAAAIQFAEKMRRKAKTAFGDQNG